MSADARATVITVYTDSRPRDGAFNGRFTAGGESLVRAASGPGLAIDQAGEILTRVTNQRYLQRDQRTVIPIGVAALGIPGLRQRQAAEWTNVHYASLVALARLRA